MKTLARALSALALLGIATPALPCPSMLKTAQQPETQQPGAKEKEKIAKSEKDAKAKQRRGAPAERPAATATN